MLLQAPNVTTIVSNFALYRIGPLYPVFFTSGQEIKTVSAFESSQGRT